MFAWLKNRRDRQRTARKLYGSIVTQARLPAFYADWGVPDTTQGRVEMLLLHLVLATHRLSAAGLDGQHLARALTEAFVTNMDDSMREMTFSDLAVPREIKRSTAALFDRHRAYRAALSTPDNAPLAEALAAQLAYIGLPENWDPGPLAAYVRDATSRLSGTTGAQVLAGNLDWPDPLGSTP